MPPTRTRLELLGLIYAACDPLETDAVSSNLSCHRRATTPPVSPVNEQIAFGSLSISAARRRVEQLEAEHAALTLQLKLCLEENDKLVESAGVVQRALEDNLICPICHEEMTNPNVLRTCGHSFCFDCLRHYLVDIMAKEAEGGIHLRRIPRRLRRFDPLTVTTRDLRKLRKLMPRSNYTCPVCRAPFSTHDRPILVPALQSMTTAAIRSMEILKPSADSLPTVIESSTAWDGVFCA